MSKQDRRDWWSPGRRRDWIIPELYLSIQGLNKNFFLPLDFFNGVASLPDSVLTIDKNVARGFNGV